jgi:hypothetical protein
MIELGQRKCGLRRGNRRLLLRCKGRPILSFTDLVTRQARVVAGLVDLLVSASVFGYADSGDRLASAG